MDYHVIEMCDLYSGQEGSIHYLCQVGTQQQRFAKIDSGAGFSVNLQAALDQSIITCEEDRLYTMVNTARLTDSHKLGGMIFRVNNGQLILPDLKPLLTGTTQVKSTNVLHWPPR